MGLDLCDVCLIACCGPPICIFYAFGICCCPSYVNRRGRGCVVGPTPRQQFETRQLKAPRPLPLRKRALTLPLPTLSDCPAVQRTSEQKGSLLFRLPRELRDLIYAEVLGGCVVHVLIRKDRKLGHQRCKAVFEDTVDDGERKKTPKVCFCIVDTGLGFRLPRDCRVEAVNWAFLPLLKTCRRIYSEAIDILYSANTFEFRDLDALRYFPSLIPPQRRDTITSLRLNWHLWWALYQGHNDPAHGIYYPPQDEATWEDVWRTIASMRGLRDLHVRLNHASTPRIEEEKLLEPLKIVKIPKRFVVYTAWHGDLTFDDAPFRLMRPAQSDEET